jgi:hypothetical protein
MPPLQQPVKPPAADKPADVPPPQTGEPGITSVPPPAAAPPAAAPPPAEPPAETTPPQQPAAVPPPQQPAPEPERAAPPAASTPPPPPIAEEPGGDVFAFNHGAPSHDLPQTSGPDTIRAPSTGFEDEVATDVYELGAAAGG